MPSYFDSVRRSRSSCRRMVGRRRLRDCSACSATYATPARPCCKSTPGKHRTSCWYWGGGPGWLDQRPPAGPCRYPSTSVAIPSTTNARGSRVLPWNLYRRATRCKECRSTRRSLRSAIDRDTSATPRCCPTIDVLFRGRWSCRWIYSTDPPAGSSTSTGSPVQTDTDEKPRRISDTGKCRTTLWNTGPSCWVRRGWNLPWWPPCHPAKSWIRAA